MTSFEKPNTWNAPPQKKTGTLLEPISEAAVDLEGLVITALQPLVPWKIRRDFALSLSLVLCMCVYIYIYMFSLYVY